MPNTYDFLDLNDFRSVYVDETAPQSMKFFIDGIRCSKCVSKIEHLSAVNPELKKIEVDMANQMAYVEMKSKDSSFGRVAQEITNLGFRVVPLQPSDDFTQAWKSESRKDLVRLGIAAFCAGNIMMLAFATYFGLQGSLKSSFEWIQFALYLPVVSYVALPFYQGFLAGLKQRSLSIDGPMAIASFLGFVVSTWNIFRGAGAIYFDSLSGFLFLILATRYIQKRIRFEYLKHLRPSALAETMRARLVVNGQWLWRRSDQLLKEDVILIEKGEWAPADGELLDTEAVIDLSILNGEAMPRRIHSGFSVKAGSRLLTKKAQLRVQKSGAQTLLGHLLESLRGDSKDIANTQNSKFSDRASQILLLTVLSLAILTLIGAFGNSFDIRFERALALIILACPCAMAFGTPLAFSFSMKRAQDRGIIIKSSKVFEALENIRTIFLDKTGTVTERTWSLAESSLLEVPHRYRHIILNLEARSNHPIAFALRDLWSASSKTPALKVEDWNEIPSQGVQGKIEGQLWTFKHFLDQDKKWFGLYRDDELLWKFQLTPALQPGAKDVVAQLIQQGFDVRLMSGDSLAETLKTARELGIPESHAMAEMTPQSKAEEIRKSPNSMMIGDGVNDSLALNEARVGIAVKGGVEMALKTADVLFVNEGLSSLQDLLLMAGNARRQIRRNLLTALVYNSAGGIAALLGFVNPFVAALLMPISSMVILFSTWWGTKS